MGRSAVAAIGRFMSRSIGQLALSVVTTLAATLLTSGVVERWRAAEARPEPQRAADPAVPPSPTRPGLSIVNWSVTPLHPFALIDDPGWSGLGGPAEPRGATPAPKASRHVLRRSATGPADLPPPAEPLLHAAAGPVPDPGWVARTASVTRGVVAAGGSALAPMGAELLRWLPLPR